MKLFRLLCFMITISNSINAMLSLPFRIAKSGIKSVTKVPKQSNFTLSKSDFYLKKSSKIIKNNILKNKANLYKFPRALIKCDNIIKISRRSFFSERDYNVHIQSMNNECIFMLKDFEKILKSLNTNVELEKSFKSLIPLFKALVFFEISKDKICRSDFNRKQFSELNHKILDFEKNIEEIISLIKNLDREDLIKIVNNKDNLKLLSIKKILEEIDLTSGQSMDKGIEVMYQFLKKCLCDIINHVYTLDNLIVYDSFYSSFERTSNRNDIIKNIKIKTSEFIELVVQASKTTELDSKPFKELLNKIQNQEIDISSDFVYITEKDMGYRLLSYIPTTGCKAFRRSLVNNLEVNIKNEVQEEFIKDNKEIVYLFYLVEISKKRTYEYLYTDNGFIYKEFEKLIK